MHMGRGEAEQQFEEIERVAPDTSVEVKGATLVKEFFLRYIANGAFSTIAHLRIYQRGERMIVVAGDLADNDSTSVTNGVQDIIATLRNNDILPFGTPFELITHLPASRDDPHGEFDKVTFSERRDSRGKLQVGNISWQWLDPERIASYVGAPVKIYKKDEYRSDKLSCMTIAQT